MAPRPCLGLSAAVAAAAVAATVALDITRAAAPSVLMPSPSAVPGSTNGSPQPHAFAFFTIVYTPERQASNWFWLLGVLVTLCGATLTVIGFLVQKHSHRTSKPNNAQYWMEWRWLVGLGLWILGQALCWVADGLASKSLIACLNCWNIVVVFLLAPVFFGEPVTERSKVGAALVLAGCLWVVLAGPRGYFEQTVDTLRSSWVDPRFLWVALLSALPAVAIVVQSAVTRRVVPLHYAALSATCAWYSVLFAKCTSTLTVTSVQDRNQITHWIFWVYALGVVLLAVAQMHTLNLGLKSSMAVSILPIYESLSMTGQIVLCGVFFNEFRGFSTSHMVLFAGGVICTLFGVVLLTRARHHEERGGGAGPGPQGAPADA